MPLITLKCPECNGEIQLDDAREFGFCMYCGSKVLLERATSAECQPSLRNILMLAADALESRDWDSAGPKIDQALVLDIGCSDAWYMKAIVSWAAGDNAAMDRALKKGKATEDDSLGIFSLEDYNRIRGMKVVFMMERGVGHIDTTVKVFFPWTEFEIKGVLEIRIPPGIHKVVFKETDRKGKLLSKMNSTLRIDRERAYKIKVGLRGMSVEPA